MEIRYSVYVKGTIFSVNVGLPNFILKVSFSSFLGVYGQQPANQVIIRERYRDSDSDLALGMLAGAATGMALGSLFWVF